MTRLVGRGGSESKRLQEVRSVRLMGSNDRTAEGGRKPTLGLIS